jgi:hypothetical protein
MSLQFKKKIKKKLIATWARYLAKIHLNTQNSRPRLSIRREEEGNHKDRTLNSCVSAQEGLASCDMSIHPHQTACKH